MDPDEETDSDSEQEIDAPAVYLGNALEEWNSIFEDGGTMRFQFSGVIKMIYSKDMQNTRHKCIPFCEVSVV